MYLLLGFAQKDNMDVLQKQIFWIVVSKDIAQAMKAKS